MLAPFSFQTRRTALEKFQTEAFDFLIVGGGITGAGVARDLIYRGYSVALVEQNDFASGTSSASSKMIHGGLRYLENFEFALVFEALSERALLLKNNSNLVKPLPFLLPVYETDKRGMFVLSLGLWLYDLLSLFRTPGMHKRLSAKTVLKLMPYLKSEGLVGGYSYFDASMWDDVLTVETVRDAAHRGAQVANYVSFEAPIWKDEVIVGGEVVDRISQKRVQIQAKKVIFCGGPWTDILGEKVCAPETSISKDLSDIEMVDWQRWLTPSQGVHLMFDHKRLPVPATLVMSHPKDDRISFVIPRLDYGAGVTIVGTTDAPFSADPSKVSVTHEEVNYLMTLLNRYFPELNLQTTDILSATVGVRPLFGGKQADQLQKVSREHHIESGPGQSVFVAGGKYTTYRKMAQEISDYAFKHWGPTQKPKPYQKKISTKLPLNKSVTSQALESVKNLNPKLVARFGAEAKEILEISKTHSSKTPEPDGFPEIEAQFRYCILKEMVMSLGDFYFRRQSLFYALKDHGKSFSHRLAEILADELQIPDPEKNAFIQNELQKLDAEIQKREAWRKTF